MAEIPPSHSNYKISREERRDGWDYAKLVAEFVGLGFVIAYTIFTARIYSANQKAADAAQKTLGEIKTQTTLIRQQLIGTQAAVVVIAEYPGLESPQTNNYGFNIGLRNDGHVVASRVNVTLIARRETLNGGKPIGEPWHCDFNLPPILPTKVGEHQCFLEGLNKRSWQPIGQFKQTIAVDGRFSYWNGFEDAPSEPICLRYVPSGLRSKFGSAGPGSFVTCDRYPGWIEYLKARLAGNGEIQPPPRQ